MASAADAARQVAESAADEAERRAAGAHHAARAAAAEAQQVVWQVGGKCACGIVKIKNHKIFPDFRIPNPCADTAVLLRPSIEPTPFCCFKSSALVRWRDTAKPIAKAKFSKTLTFYLFPPLCAVLVNA